MYCVCERERSSVSAVFICVSLSAYVCACVRVSGPYAPQARRLWVIAPYMVTCQITSLWLRQEGRGAIYFPPPIASLPFNDHYEWFMLYWHVSVCPRVAMRRQNVSQQCRDGARACARAYGLHVAVLGDSKSAFLERHFLLNIVWQWSIWYVGPCECYCEAFGIWWHCARQKDYCVC